MQANENRKLDGEAEASRLHFEAGGTEEDISGERLELLCVVRGLEALDQPSRVTLITPSPYVREGIRYGLEQWRENDWQWESFGRMVPVKNQDLWQRVDIALKFHHLECLTWRFDAAHESEPEAESSKISTNTEETSAKEWIAARSVEHALALYNQAKRIVTQCLTSIRQRLAENIAA